MLRVFLAVFALCLQFAAKQITLRIPLDSEHIAVVTFDAPDTEYKGTDFAQCQVHVETLNKSQACHQVVFNWNNCVLHTMEKQLGGYPKDKWTAFLDVYGIQERVEQTIGDRTG